MTVVPDDINAKTIQRYFEYVIVLVLEILYHKLGISMYFSSIDTTLAKVVLNTYKSRWSCRSS
jgi:hypothetical protein